MILKKLTVIAASAYCFVFPHYIYGDYKHQYHYVKSEYQASKHALDNGKVQSSFNMTHSAKPDQRLNDALKTPHGFDINDSYMCKIAQHYNVTCKAIKRFAIDRIRRDFQLEKEKQKREQETISPYAPYTIEPKTHRIWITSPHAPQEVPRDRLAFYNMSLQFYLDKPFEHHFWCNGKHLIPQSISIIESFNIQIIIHELSEVEESFIAKNLYRKLLRDNMFSFAGKIARQEILIQHGGLYADIGMMQLQDIEWYFKKYELVLPIKRTSMDNHFLAAKKGTNFFSTSLALIKPLMLLVKEKKAFIEPYHLFTFLDVRIWKLVAAMENCTLSELGFFYEETHYKQHGLNSWSKNILKITIPYLIDWED